MRDFPRPAPTRDLDAPEQIAEMVRRFYADVAQDDLLGPIFEDVARVDWSEHLPKLTAFWCRALLGQPGYQGNPFRAHALVHGKRPFTRAHFERWLTLFDETLEFGWTGPDAPCSDSRTASPACSSSGSVSATDRARELAAAVAKVHSHQLLGEPVVLGPAVVS
jgi:hemoglobin